MHTDTSTSSGATLAGDSTGVDTGSTAPPQGTNSAGSSASGEAGTTSTSGGEQNCTKIDFLFVIDDSAGMAGHQSALADAFPAFWSDVLRLSGSIDVQVGVVATEAYTYNSIACAVFGGLVVQTGGADSTASVCGPYADGLSFMTSSDDLITSFACAAGLGTSGNGTERPMNAMEVVVRRDVGMPGQCNEGFIRDDALLVVAIVTDEWDGPGDPEGMGSTGDPMSWYDTVVQAKLGRPESVVVLSQVHTDACPPTMGSLNGAIEAFTELFDYGYVGCLATDDLWTGGAGAEIVAEACGAFELPG